MASLNLIIRNQFAKVLIKFDNSTKVTELNLIKLDIDSGG